jgi:exonuclease III
VSELNETIDQKGIIDIYRIFHLTAEEYTFFSAVHRTFSKVDIRQVYSTEITME